MGKSKLVESINLQLIAQGAGTCLVDSDSRTTDDNIAHINELEEELGPMVKWKTHYLKPSEDGAFAYDPFHTTLTGRDFEFWLDRKVETVKKILIRPHGIADLRQQMRRDRVLSNALYIIATRGRNGKHRGLGGLLEALDFGSDQWERSFNLVCENLKLEVARDCWRLHRMNAHDLRLETESSLNLVTPFFTSFVKQTLSGKAPPIDFMQIVKYGHIVLASLGETPFFSGEQGRIFAAMIVNDVEEACWFVQKRYYLICEEADRVLGTDLKDVLRRARKHKLSCILVGNSLSAFRDQYTDIRDDVLSQPDIHILFRQKTDLDDLAELAGTPTLKFDQLLKPMDRPDGHDWHVVPEVSMSEGQKMDWGEGTDVSTGESDGGMEGEGESEEEGTTRTRSHDVSRGTTKGTGVTQSEQHGKSGGRSGPESLMDKDRIGKSKHSDWSESSGTQYSDTEQESESQRDGMAEGVSFKKGRKTSRGRNWSKSLTHGQKQNFGVGTTSQKSVAFRHIPLQRYRTEWYPAGLKEDSQTQYAKVKKKLRTLEQQEFVIVKGNKRPVVCRAHDLPDPFEEFPMIGQELTKRLIKMICERKPYFFIPTECEKWVRKLPSRKPTNGSSNGSTIPTRWSRFGFIVPKPPQNGSRNSNGTK